MKNCKTTATETSILLSIPILIILGSLMHFIYEWSGNLTIVGILAPINESVWEHLKLTLYPTILWWLIGYFIFKRKCTISKEQWFSSAAVAVITCHLVILSFFYTYTGALGIESLMLDIFSLFLGVIISQYLALHLYKFAKLNTVTYFIAIIIFIFLIITFTLFTFNPPHFPIFMDSITGKYGI